MRLSIGVTQLMHRQCERNDPTKCGGKPPIRFVPEVEDSDAVKTKGSVKIRMDDDVIKVFDTFKSGDAEAVVNLIREHESIVSDHKLKEKYSAASALWNTKKTALAATSDADEKAELQTEIAEHKKTCEVSQSNKP